MAKTKTKTKTHTFRIPAAEVLAAYEKTRLVPMHKSFSQVLNGIACGCPLSALYELHTKKRAPGMSDKVLEWAIRRYGEEYEIGFVHGVDGSSPDSGSPRRYGQGHADGKKVFKAMLKKFVTVYSPDQEQYQ